MLSITFLTVGKCKEKWMLEGIAEYQKRLQSFCHFSIVEIPEYRISTKPSQSEIQKGLEKEGEQILGKILPRSKVIALCVEGKLQSSEQLSQTMMEYAKETSQLYFIIGSSFGLADFVKREADLCLSMSPMTFPHQLARVLLCEQVYRGLSITAGTKYHK